MKVPTQKPNLVSGKPKVVTKKKPPKEKLSTSEKEVEDVSVVGSSISTAVHGVKELVKAVAVGTREFQDLLMNECSLIYECRVCRNLFRSVANFISHKRGYCRKHYHYFSHGFFNDELESTSQVEQTMQVEPEPPPPPPSYESIEEHWMKNGEATVSSRRKNSFPQATGAAALQRSPPMKLLSRVLWPDGKKGVPMRRVRTPPTNNSSILCKLEDMNQSAQAVFQTVIPVPDQGDSSAQSIQQELRDLHSSSKGREAVIMEDGHVAKPDGSFVCSKCDSPFSSSRILERHKAVYHQPRICYPCPICKVFLASPWGVYRHLSKVHHKSEEQIRRLRAQILAKAAKRELYQASRGYVEVPGTDTAKIEAKEEEKWIAQFEGELHCTICGKSFSRRAALSVHSAKCKVVVSKPNKPDTTPEHSGPQNCEKCGKEFARKAVLVVHAQTCNGNSSDLSARTQRCAYCGRVFARRRALTLHLLRCQSAPKVSPRSPLSLLLTPPKLPTVSSVVSPSAIQIRRDYCKPSPLATGSRCCCPERCAIHPPLPSRLEAVVKKLQEKTSSEEVTSEQTFPFLSVVDVRILTTVDKVVNSPDRVPSNLSPITRFSPLKGKCSDTSQQVHDKVEELVEKSEVTCAEEDTIFISNASNTDNLEMKDVAELSNVLENVLTETRDEGNTTRDDLITSEIAVAAMPNSASPQLTGSPIPVDRVVTDLSNKSSSSIDLSEATKFVEPESIPSCGDIECDVISLTSRSCTDRSDDESPSEEIPEISTVISENGDDSGMCNDSRGKSSPFQGFDLTDLIYDSVLFRMKSLVECHQRDIMSWSSKEGSSRRRFANGADTRFSRGDKVSPDAKTERL